MLMIMGMKQVRNTGGTFCFFHQKFHSTFINFSRNWSLESPVGFFIRRPRAMKSLSSSHTSEHSKYTHCTQTPPLQQGNPSRERHSNDKLPWQVSPEEGRSASALQCRLLSHTDLCVTSFFPWLKGTFPGTREWRKLDCWHHGFSREI